MKKDIENREDIRLLVNGFYEKVRKDEVLGDIFNDVIGDNWDPHLGKMYDFWQTVLLNEPLYRGKPFPPHWKLPIDEQHFTRWLELFSSTVDEYFDGPKAKEAKWRASKMAEMFQYKLSHFRKLNGKPLL